MRTERCAAWILALLVAAAAATKLVAPEELGHEISGLLHAAGLGRPPELFRSPGVVALCVLEISIAVLVVLPRRSRIGLAALVVVMAAGVLLVGAGSSWGRDADFACPCGLLLELPFVRNEFAAMLVRDALLLTLVAMAWGVREDCSSRTTTSVRPGTGAAA